MGDGDEERSSVESPGGPRVGLRPMEESDLTLVGDWLAEPHVARWWLLGTTRSAEMADIGNRVRGEADEATKMLIVNQGARPIGFCQWYLWDDYPSEVADIGAHPGEAGIDYAIGDPAAIGRGLGTQMIAALVREIRRHRPGVGVVVGPEEGNRASRRVLERNGFTLVGVRQLQMEPPEHPSAIYRLEPDVVRLAGPADAKVIARLLDEFNREFDEPTPGAEALASRIDDLIRGGDVDVLLGGAGPDGVAVLRFRPSIWTAAAEAYLAELYVRPGRRDLGLGRAMICEALAQARRRGADWMSIEVDEPDAAARHLYESVGFTNRVGGPGGPVMFVYEREL